MGKSTNKKMVQENLVPSDSVNADSILHNKEDGDHENSPNHSC